VLPKHTRPDDLRIGCRCALSARAELVLSTVLRVGVLSSLALILAGTVITFAHNPEVSSPDELAQLTEPGASFPHTLRDVVTGLGDFRGQAVVLGYLRPSEMRERISASPHP
jgi:hypothetical protein